MTTKKMFKVLCPMEGKNGSKWWMRCGSGFPNKDDSINIYLDAVPTKPGFTLQLREYTDEDMKQSAERRASIGHAPVRHGVRADASFDPVATSDGFVPAESNHSNQSLPF
jgi:hypothetical protein